MIRPSSSLGAGTTPLAVANVAGDGTLFSVDAGVSAAKVGRHRRRPRRPGTTLAAVAATILLLLLLIPWVRHQLALSFTNQPLPYTELYFAVPPSISGGGAAPITVTVQFTLVNHNDPSGVYPYIVRAAAAGRDLTTSQGTITLNDRRDTATVSQRLDLPSSSPSPILLEVMLSGRPQHLTYRLELPRP